MSVFFEMAEKNHEPLSYTSAIIPREAWFSRLRHRVQLLAQRICMKKTFLGWVLIASALSTTIGCSSVRSRYDTPADQWTVYPGIQRDGKDMVGTLTGDVKPLWTSALVGPVLVADVPFSLVTDTFALPYDLYAMSRHP